MSYTLLEGDCLDRMQEIPDGFIDMVLTDPPYGTTACKWDVIIPLVPMWEQVKRIIKSNGAIVLMASQPFTSVLIMSNLNMFKYCWVWNKKQGGNPLNSKRQPLRITEDVVVFNEKGMYRPQMRTGKLRKKGGINKQPETTGRVRLGYQTYNNQYYPISIINIALNGINPVGLNVKVVFGVTCARISPVKSGTQFKIEQPMFTSAHLNFIPLKIT